MRFLNYELGNAGINREPPHFCLMYMRPMLGLGSRCKLEDACRNHGVDYSASHVAANDAMAAGKLFTQYLAEINRRGVSTYADLASLKSYKFNESFRLNPFPDPSVFGLRRSDKNCSRAGFAVTLDPVRQAIIGYWDALGVVLADLNITDDEVAYVAAERERGGLKEEQIRVLHARAFTSVISQFTSDQWLDDREIGKLRRLRQCLSRLGWAPGD
jgi:hypothetical protein